MLLQLFLNFVFRSNFHVIGTYYFHRTCIAQALGNGLPWRSLGQDRRLRNAFERLALEEREGPSMDDEAAILPDRPDATTPGGRLMPVKTGDGEITHVFVAGYVFS